MHVLYSWSLNPHLRQQTMTYNIFYIFMGFFGDLINNFFTQRWIGKRERRNRRDDLRLKLYSEVNNLILDNEQEWAERGTEGKNPSMELQAKRIDILNRLKIHAPKKVQDAYDKYRKLVFQEIENPIKDRPKNTNEFHRAHDQLIELIAKDTQRT